MRYTRKTAVVQEIKPLIVTLQRDPEPSTSIADVIIGSLGLVGVLTVLALIAGAFFGAGLVYLRRRRQVEDEHMPPVSPQIPLRSQHGGPHAAERGPGV
jgi:hypothetical protein